MNKIDEDTLIVKRTFEDTLNAQEELRDTLETLIKENRCLTKEEKGFFIRQLSHATFGLGREFEVTYFSKKFGHLNWGTPEFFARTLTRLNKNTYFIDNTTGTNPNDKGEVPISYLWEKLLYALFQVFPMALDRASAMSKEHDISLSGDAYEFNPK